MMELDRSELNELGRLHREHGYGFAIEGVRLLTILNGGALAALPVATEAFNTVQIPFGALVVSAILFVAGLISVASMLFCAFQGEDLLAVAYHRIARGHRGLHRSPYARYGVKYYNFHKGALVSGVSSLSFFCLACALLLGSAHNRLEGIWGPFDADKARLFEQLQERSSTSTE
jgi:hypothetical protein